MSNDPNINIKILIKNLHDLDNISQKIISETEQKNKILQKGLNDCKVCLSYMKKNNKQQ